MENIQWVSELPPSQRRFAGRRGDGQIQRLVAELRNRPNQWALYRVLEPGKKFTSYSTYMSRYTGTEWAIRQIDGKQHIYVRWVGDAQ